MTVATTETQREDQLRRLAARQGYRLIKSRVRSPHLDDHGGYQLVETNLNLVVAGEKYDLTLDDVETSLTD